MSWLKRAPLALFLIPVLAFVACSGSGKSGSGAMTVWTTDSVTKVLQQGDYSDKTDQTVLEISMAQNESEGGQVILSAKEKIHAYTVEVSDLFNGMAKISKSNIQIFAEKYITIAAKQNTNKEFPPGSRVPDAILPIDKTIYYGENTIENGNNQGLYIEVKTDKQTPAGRYSGTVTITADSTVYEVPMSVTVWDFALSDTPSTKNYLSLFAREAYGSVELDSTDEMATAYFEKLLDYRMNSELPFSGVGGPAKYVELLRKYYNHPGFSSYRFYYQLVGNGNKFDTALTQEYLEAVIQASMEDEINYLDKAFFYFSNLIDEPNNVYSYNDTKIVQTMYEIVLRSTDEACKAKFAASENYAYYLNTISPVLLAIPDVLTVTNSNSHQILESEYGVTGATYCPLINLFQPEECRGDYFENTRGQVWWYTAMVPLYPYPSNHLDDYALPYRIMSWMQKAYDIDGYLMWAVANYSSNNMDVPTGDPYGDATRGDAFPPGDGFMFYPGSRYGIQGPVASMRAVAYRDGMEEYEYLTELQKCYESRNMDATQFLNSIYDRLFTNVTPIHSSDLFLDVRSELGELISSMNSDFGVLYEEVKIVGSKAFVTFNTVSDEAEVYFEGQKLSKNADGTYKVTVDLTNTNILTLEIKCNGQSKTVSRRLAGKYLSIEDFETFNMDLIRVHKTSATEICKDSGSVITGAASLKVTLRGRDDAENYRPYFSIAKSDINGGALSEVEHLTLSVSVSEAVSFSLFGFIGDRYEFIEQYNLQPGINYLQIKNVFSNASLSSIQGFYFMTDNFAGEKVIYIDDVACTLLG